MKETPSQLTKVTTATVQPAINSSKLINPTDEATESSNKKKKDKGDGGGTIKNPTPDTPKDGGDLKGLPTPIDKIGQKKEEEKEKEKIEKTMDKIAKKF